MHYGSSLIGAVVGVALALAGQEKKAPAAGAIGPEALVGTWLFAGDLTPDCPAEQRGTNYSNTFIVRLEDATLLLERPRGNDPTPKARCARRQPTGRARKSAWSRRRATPSRPSRTACAWR